MGETQQQQQQRCHQRESEDVQRGRWQKSSARCGERLNPLTRPSLIRTQLLPRRSGRLRRRLTSRRETLRLRRAGMRKMRRRRRLKTANKKRGQSLGQKKPKGEVANLPQRRSS